MTVTLPSITRLMDCPARDAANAAARSAYAAQEEAMADAICGTREERAAAPRPARKTTARIDHGAYTAGQTIQWELVSCGRCGGSGQYSIGTCFGCNGSGEVYSRAAAAAKKLWEAKVAEFGAVTYGDLRVGDRVRRPGTIYSKWSTVTAVEESSSASVLADGTRVPLISVTTSRYGRVSAAPDMTGWVRPLTVEEATEAWTVLRHRKGLTVIRPA